jgi:hypothetical protein
LSGCLAWRAILDAKHNLGHFFAKPMRDDNCDMMDCERPESHQPKEVQTAGRRPPAEPLVRAASRCIDCLCGGKSRRMD